MTLTESVAKLATLVPVLKASDAKFASDLIASFKKYGGLTPKQEPWIGKLIARAETPKPVFSAPLAVPAGFVEVGNFGGVVALFNTAKAHLKFPKVRLVVNGTKVILSLNGKQSKAPGAISLSGEGQYPNRTYYGRVSPEGVFTPAQATYGDFLKALTGILTELASNPARVAKDHGKLTGNCCFCGKVLGFGKEQRSVLVGFGPDCAEHYGLKAEWLAAAEKAEAKASVSVNPYPADEQAIGVPGFIPVVEPTLTVTPAAQAVIDGLAAAKLEAATASFAESVTKATDAVTGLTKSLVVDELIAAEADANHEALQAELGPDYIEVKECFFCEQPSTSTKTLHGFTVCAACVAQLQ